jgi:hypothetical protein
LVQPGGHSGREIHVILDNLNTHKPKHGSGRPLPAAPAGRVPALHEPHRRRTYSWLNPVSALPLGSQAGGAVQGREQGGGAMAFVCPTWGSTGSSCFASMRKAGN